MHGFANVKFMCKKFDTNISVFFGFVVWINLLVAAGALLVCFALSVLTQSDGIKPLEQTLGIN